MIAACRSTSSTASRVETPGEGHFWVAPNAVLIGKVILEDDASVWFGACCAATTSRSASARARTCRTAACCTPTRAFRSTVGADCTIGHMVMLHGCTIGRGSLIGIGSIILNGAKIGEECLIGANTLIAEGKEIPPRSMVLGSPGKIVRQLSDEDVAALRRRSRTLRQELEAVRRGDETAGVSRLRRAVATRRSGSRGRTVRSRAGPGGCRAQPKPSG